MLRSHAPSKRKPGQDATKPLDNSDKIEQESPEGAGPELVPTDTVDQVEHSPRVLSGADSSGSTNGDEILGQTDAQLRKLYQCPEVTVVVSPIRRSSNRRIPEATLDGSQESKDAYWRPSQHSVAAKEILGQHKSDNPSQMRESSGAEKVEELPQVKECTVVLERLTIDSNVVIQSDDEVLTQIGKGEGEKSDGERILAQSDHEDGNRDDGTPPQHETGEESQEILTQSDQDEEILTRSDQEEEILTQSDQDEEILTRSDQEEEILTQSDQDEEILTQSDQEEEILTQSDQEEENEGKGTPPQLETGEESEEILTQSDQEGEKLTQSDQEGEKLTQSDQEGEKLTQSDQGEENEGKGTPPQLETGEESEEILTQCDQDEEILTQSDQDEQIRTQSDQQEEIATQSDQEEGNEGKITPPHLETEEEIGGILTQSDQREDIMTQSDQEQEILTQSDQEEEILTQNDHEEGNEKEGTPTRVKVEGGSKVILNQSDQEKELERVGVRTPMEKESESEEDEDVIESSQIHGTPSSARRSLFRSSKLDQSAITSFYEFPTFVGGGGELDQTRSDEEEREEILERIPMTTWIPKASAPTRQDVLNSCDRFQIPSEKHVRAFCSNKADVPEKAIDLGLQRIKLAWKFDLPEFRSELSTKTLTDLKMERLESLGLTKSELKSGNLSQLLASSGTRDFTFIPVRRAPSRKEVVLWLRARDLLAAEPGQHLGSPKDQIRYPEVDQDVDDIPDFDADSPSEAIVNQSQVILRARRNSEDSLGSEVSCSPPSSPERPDIQEEEFLDTPPKETDCSTPMVLTSLRRESSPDDQLATVLSESIKRPLWDIKPKPGLKKRRISWDLSISDGESSSSQPALEDDGDDEDPDFINSSQPEDAPISPSPIAGTSTETTHNLRKRLLRTQFRRKFLTPEPSLGERLAGKPNSPSSPIEGPSPNNTHNFKMSFENLKEVKAMSEHQHLSVMSMELHVSTRQKLLPDPEFDSIAAIFVLVANDVPEKSLRPRRYEGMYVLDTEDNHSLLITSGVVRENIHYYATEKELFLGFVDAVQAHDPDILCGYEVQMSSWGFLIKRAVHCDVNMAPLLSRLPTLERESKMNEEEDVFGADHTSELHIAGRVVLNLWRLMRSEVAFYSYTFENMMFHVLHERVPKHEHLTLTQWWSHTSSLYRWRVVDYYLKRIHGNLNLMEQLDVIGRTSELARLFGIQFFEVISRGSQFRVESLMLRLAKRRNLIPVSPNTMQKAKMKAPEYIPLVMEPESRFYTDPLIVLDFQSLYPSIIMAYNYCYSTCLGRVQNLGSSAEPFEFGCTQLKISPQRLEKLVGHLNFSPGGVAFLKPALRKGVLPQMLKEILDTRLMVKKSMKLHKGDKTLQRVLHSRQLGLKLIANVTYGYTSANFSGRMPCVEVADSVVSKGRETLERCIRYIENTEKWKAKVVYGDTDSVFVLLPGRTKDEAFKIGEEIAAEITLDNPKPIKLKFEKVYYPCILQTKKRYVGYMYETPDQKVPVYDAKGIETVRRDGCPAVVKILERTLRILFETKDVSKVKLFVQRQFQKVMKNKASIQDLTFAKEFRGVSGYKPTALVPALELTRRMTRFDRRAVPRTGQRVPYIIVYGEPGRPLIQSVRSPAEVLNDRTMRPNAQYYICKVIGPPLNRCLSLIGVDVLAWYLELPKFYRPRLGKAMAEDARPGSSRGGQGVILKYFASHHCASCDNLTQKPICDKCLGHPQRTVLSLSTKIRQWDKSIQAIRQICSSCTGFPDLYNDACISLDCPVLYQRKICQFDEEQVGYVQNLLNDLTF